MNKTIIILIVFSIILIGCVEEPIPETPIDLPEEPFEEPEEQPKYEEYEGYSEEEIYQILEELIEKEDYSEEELIEKLKKYFDETA